MGERRASALHRSGTRNVCRGAAVRVDYIELVDWATLEPVEIAAPGSAVRGRGVGWRDAADRQHDPSVTGICGSASRTLLPIVMPVAAL